MFFFFFNDTATTEIYTLSLHDALPIYLVLLHGRHQIVDGGRGDREIGAEGGGARIPGGGEQRQVVGERDRKSTRLNSSHLVISYAVFCLKKKKKITLSPILHLYQCDVE